jgi:hypothetical protein
MDYAIEKNVPIDRYSGKWKQLTEDMRRGDSVLMSWKDSQSFREHLRRKGILAVVRKNADATTDEDGYRLWRRT